MDYNSAAEAGWLLTLAGYYVATGGGTGIMEAVNLGAYLATYSRDAIDDAIAILSRSPRYSDTGFVDRCVEVADKYPEGKEGLAIPTWFYGHEPSNLFGTKIAKYFSNSIREDGLLAIALHGIVYAPGGGGTTQEVFQDACQNHYGTFGFFSPMVFLSRRRYETDTLIYPCLKQLAAGKAYEKLLSITDDPEHVVSFLQANPPTPS